MFDFGAIAMSSSAQAASQQAAPVKPGQVLIVGRVRARRSFNTQQGRRFETVVVLPAADAYSSPATVAVQSGQSIGEREDDVRVLCQVGGFSRTFKQTDGETGEVRQVATADVRLTAVE
jgi:hypothetical protein